MSTSPTAKRHLTASLLAKLDRDNRKAEVDTAQMVKDARRDLLMTKMRDYIEDCSKKPGFSLPLHVSCYHNSTRGLRIQTTPDELKPIAEAVCLELSDDTTIMYVSDVNPSFTDCDCGPTYCGHSGSIELNTKSCKKD